MTDMQGAVRRGPFVLRRSAIWMSLYRFFHRDWRSWLFGFLGYPIVDKLWVGQLATNQLQGKCRFATIADLRPDAKLIEVVVDGKNRKCVDFFVYHLWIREVDLDRDLIIFDGEGDVNEELERTCRITEILQRFELLPARGRFSFGALLVEEPEE